MIISRINRKCLRNFFVGRIDFNLSFLRYIILCVAGSSICYLLYLLFPQYPFQWSIISVLIVLAPEKRDARKLAFDRIKANVLGSSVGLISFLIHKPDLGSLILSVVMTIILCQLFNLGKASRSALAALVIVLILEKESNNFNAAIERMGCVITGCVVALMVTSVFQNSKLKSRKVNSRFQRLIYKILS